MNRRPTDEQLSQLLKTPHFGQGSELPPNEAVAPTPMVLALNQIKPYDRNPRRERNPLYDEIKDSVLAQKGLNNPLTVTRRPDEEHYMVESGGNTRLQILNELLSETGDDSFRQIHVLYRPWKSEFHVLTAHLIENEKRGDMLFIDKALAVRELKEMYEATDEKRYSKRQLALRLKEEGFAIDLAIISRMDYAVDTLLQVIPEALRAGMGRPQIERIRRLEKAYRTYWIELSGQEEATFDELFQDCLAENNRAEWDSDALRITTEERMTSLLTVPMRAMRLDIDALLHGRTVGAESEIETSHIETPSIDSPPQTDVVEPTPVKDGINDSGEALNNTPSNPAPATPDEAATVTIATSASELPDDTTPFSEPENDGNEGSAPFNISRARHNAYETAHSLATRYQLEQCLCRSFDWGLGFLVDLPAEPLIPANSDHLDAKQQWEQILRQWIWWFLYICSEETARPERIPNMPESMVIRDLCLKQDQAELMRLIGQPSWVTMACQLLADPLLPDDDFHTLMELIRHCRTLRQQIDNNDDALWMERNDYAST